MKTHSFSPPPLFHQYSRGSHGFEAAEPGDARFSTRACTIKYEILKYLMDTIDERENVEKMQKGDKNMMDKIFFKTKGELNKVNKKNLCESYGFVEQAPRSGVGDHFFPVRNIGSKISIYGTNNDWNKLPVKGTSNVQYTTQVVEKDLPNDKTELAIFDSELMKIDKIIGDKDSHELSFEDFLGVMLGNIRQQPNNIKSIFDEDIESLKNCKFRIISRTGSERTAFWAKFPDFDRIKSQATLITNDIRPTDKLQTFVKKLSLTDEEKSIISDLKIEQERTDLTDVLYDNKDEYGNLDESNIKENITSIEKKLEKECIFILGKKIKNGTSVPVLLDLVNANFEMYDTNIRKMIHRYTMEELLIGNKLSVEFKDKLLGGGDGDKKRMSFATWYVCVKHTLQDPWSMTEASLVLYDASTTKNNSKISAMQIQSDNVAFQLEVLEKIKHFIQWPISTAFKDKLKVCLYTLFGVQDKNGIMDLKKIKNSKITRPPIRWKCTPLEITIMTSLWEYYVQTRGGRMFRELAPHDVIALEELAITSEKKLIDDIQRHPAFKSILDRQFRTINKKEEWDEDEGEEGEDEGED